MRHVQVVGGVLEDVFFFLVCGDDAYRWFSHSEICISYRSRERVLCQMEQLKNSTMIVSAWSWDRQVTNLLRPCPASKKSAVPFTMSVDGTLTVSSARKKRLLCTRFTGSRRFHLEWYVRLTGIQAFAPCVVCKILLGVF